MYKKMIPIFFQINILLSIMVRIISSDTIILSSKPSMYVSNNKLQREKAFVIIDEYDEYLKYVSGKCMDVGCGPGDITNDIILPALDPNATVIGTDISENMIDYAKKRYSAEKRLKFDVLNVQTKNLPIKYVSEFDHVFSFHTLHWCNDIRKAFENIYRMLRPDGTMLVLFVASHDIFKILENLAQNSRFAPYIMDVNKYIWPFQNSVNPRKELKELLETLGFTVIHCSNRENFYFDENPNRFLSSILAFLDFIDDMPRNRREEFKKEFARKFAESRINKRNNKKNYVLDLYNVLIVFAQKRVS